MEASIMTKAQKHILELLARLPVEQRWEIVEHITQSHLLDETFFDSMTPEQRAHLQEGVTEAERGEGEEASLVMDRLARKLGVPAK